jgi:uncharacterized membrane protein YkvA (DUF1232 family)
MASPHMEKMKGWINSFAADVGVAQAVASATKLPRDARMVAAGALGYLVTRLDLIPDWEETCGILDDAMVLRLAMAEIEESSLDGLDEDTQLSVHRLANETETVRGLLGDEVYARFKRYVHELTNVVVRGRHPRTIVDDAKERAQLLVEVKDELKKLPPAPMSDPDRVERTVKNYLSLKLK